MHFPETARVWGLPTNNCQREGGTVNGKELQDWMIFEGQEDLEAKKSRDGERSPPHQWPTVGARDY